VVEADAAVWAVVTDTSQKDMSQLRDQTWRHRLAEQVEDGRSDEAETSEWKRDNKRSNFTSFQ
jgi:hypothetical protein